VKFLFVTPVLEGSGETLTALTAAEQLAIRGHDVRFLASRFATSFLRPHGLFVQEFGPIGPLNLALWQEAVESFKPDAIVFADYPLLFFAGGCPPLVAEPGWVDALAELPSLLCTFDHFGFANMRDGMFLGPPHLSFCYQTFPPLPQGMRLLLPCPMHEPRPLAGRAGETFRSVPLPQSLPEDARAAVRRRLGVEDGLLIFHAVPAWACRSAELLGLPLHHFLPELLDLFLAPLPLPVTVASVNDGRLLRPADGSTIRIVNLPPMPPDDFESIMFASDFMLTENKLSISIGKSICGLHPCGAFQNRARILELMDRLSGRWRQVIIGMENARPGSVFPFEVFPTITAEELEALGLYRGNSITAGFREFEIFGGEETGEALRASIVNNEDRLELRKAQEAYIERLRTLEDAATVLERLVEEEWGSSE
jgi:Family of unknown function (DUF6365)